MNSTSLLAFTQIVSILAYIGTAFVLYRILVANKDSLIELLREQLAAAEKRLQALESQTPDQLAESLSRRIQVMNEELLRLRNDSAANKEEIREREDRLNHINEKLSKLQGLIKDCTELVLT